MHHSNHAEAYQHGLADLMTELLGEQAEDIICKQTSIRRDTVQRRLTGGSDWTLRETIYLADMIGVTPARLVKALSQVVVYGADLGYTAIGLARASRAGETR